MFIVRRRLSLRCKIPIIGLLVGVGTAHAQGVTISQSSASITADCAGADAVIQGSGDSISLRNSCRSLTVNGSRNSIMVDLQAGGSITLNGASNSAVQAPQGTQVRLSGDVLFDFNKDTLRPDAQRGLAELSVLVARDHARGLQIVGYTDSIGTPQYNLDLSDRRARNVERWLLDYGRVQIAAVDVRGRGANDPVAPNILPDGRDNPAGRQENRRVEVLLQQ